MCVYNQIIGCEAVIESKMGLDLPGRQKGTKYVLTNGPHGAPPTPGSRLHITFIAKVYGKARGLKRPILADFYPLTES